MEGVDAGDLLEPEHKISNIISCTFKMSSHLFKLIMIKALSSLARFASVGATSWIKNLKIIDYKKENFHNLHISVSARNIGNLMTNLRL